MKDYQAAMLLVYPKLERIIRDLGQLAEAKALASYSGREATEACIGRILAYLRAKESFAALKELLGGVLAQLSREELYLLEYKYFRRRKMLEGEFADVQCAFSARTYYRRQRRLASKLNNLFLLSGADRAWFDALFADVAYMRSVLDGVRRGVCLIDKRVLANLRVRPAQPQSRAAQEQDRAARPQSPARRVQP